MKRLTIAEEEIMQMIWENGPVLVSTLISQMPDPKPPHSTISSIVRILEKKGFVSHKAYGRTYEYFPIVQRGDYSKKSIKEVVSKYFNGSPKALVSFLVKEEEVDINELKELLDKLENKK